MDLLSNLLSHYQQLLKKNRKETELIIAVIKTQTNLTITVNEIKTKEGILFLKTRPKYKLEFLLKKKELLLALEEQGIKFIDLK